MKRLLIALLLTASVPALASVSCYDNGNGTTRCTGTDASNRRVDVEAYDNGHGTTTTTGTVDNRRVEVSCYDNGHGSTTCK